MVKLNNVTLVAVSSVRINETINALIKSMSGIQYKEVIFISHEKSINLPKDIIFKKCNKLNNIIDYNNFILYELVNYIETDFVLLIQYDGYVLRPNKWNDIFLTFDYIGAPWPKNVHYNGNLNIRVGNGGFSLRSKKILNVLNELKLSLIDNGTGYFNEDGVLCNYYRKTLEENGIKYATPEIAAMFSHESNCDEDVNEPFGFHKFIK